MYLHSGFRKPMRRPEAAFLYPKQLRHRRKYRYVIFSALAVVEETRTLAIQDVISRTS